MGISCHPKPYIFNPWWCHAGLGTYIHLCFSNKKIGTAFNVLCNITVLFRIHILYIRIQWIDAVFNNESPMFFGSRRTEARASQCSKIRQKVQLVEVVLFVSKENISIFSSGPKKGQGPEKSEENIPLIFTLHLLLHYFVIYRALWRGISSVIKLNVISDYWKLENRYAHRYAHSVLV